MRNILITGASGFAGKHLAADVGQMAEYKVYGTVYGSGSDITPLIPENQQLRLNLLEREATCAALQTIQPEIIFHLAALSSPAASFKDPRATLTNNIEAQLNILDAARSLPKPPIILIIGTAEEYGRVAHTPIPESAPLNPISPYAVSKVAQDYLGLMYYHAYHLPIVRVRPFNHIGEYQTETFVVPAFAKQIALIEAGKQPPVLHVGNLTAVRDFTDVKDMAKAYWLAATQGAPGEVYNLGSGKGYSIQTVLTTLLSLTTTAIEVREDPERVQPVDIPELVCDYSRFHQLTGWKPEMPLHVTLQRVLDYWRKITAHSQ